MLLRLLRGGVGAWYLGVGRPDLVEKHSKETPNVQNGGGGGAKSMSSLSLKKGIKKALGGSCKNATGIVICAPRSWGGNTVSLDETGGSKRKVQYNQ